MDIMIKQATIEDIDELMQWRMEVLRCVFGISKDTNIKKLYQANYEYYHNTIPSKNHIAVFVKADNITVGCGGLCLYNEMPSPDNPSGKCAYLMNIYTRKQYRFQGIGRAVVKYLVDYAKKLDITKIYLETSESGRALYKSLGFRDMKEYMKL